jgi:multimeric flavodoxin WrbA
VLKVLGISTSPRLKGNSDLLLREALRGAEQAGGRAEYLRLCDYRIEGCHACYECLEAGVCQVHDDYQKVLDKMLAADRIVFALPVFFLTVPAQAKLLIDRGQCLWLLRNKLGRVLFQPPRDRRGMIIAVGGSRTTSQFDCVQRPVRACFEYLEIDCVSMLFVSQVDEKGAVLQHPEALAEALRLGRELVSERGPVPAEPVRVELFRAAEEGSVVRKAEG